METLNSQKGIVPIIAVIGIAVILVGGGSAYYFKQQQAKLVSKANVIDETTSWNNKAKNFFYADSAVEKELSQCFGDDSSTLGMNGCYSTAIEKYDAILDRVYELTLQDLAETRVADAKRSFAQYRETTCNIAYDSAEGGSIQVLLRSSCDLRMIRGQVQALCSFGAGPSECEGKIQL